jgi:predicted ATPase
LLTLTGVGGVGKTRLAVQVAAELLTEFPDGAWLVELAPVGDPGALPDAVATALGVTAQAGLTVTESIAQALSGRRLLIVLDNCEHVLDAAAELVETIVARSATVKVMATSREGLRVEAEQLWAVPSARPRLRGHLAGCRVVRGRAQAVVAGFALDTDVDTTAGDGDLSTAGWNTLAIELAAAHGVDERQDGASSR